MTDTAALCYADLLPPELLASIFVRLDIQERFRAAAVCRKWAQAAREPPHNTCLDLAIAGDLAEGDAGELLRRKRRELAAKRPRSDSEHAELQALSVAAAAKVVRHPICAGVSRLRIRVCSVALESPDDLPAGDCGLPEVLGACGARLEALEVAAGRAATDASTLVSRSGGLEHVAPALRSLWLSTADGLPGRIQELTQVPRLARLEELGASAAVAAARPAALLERLPSLRACYGLHLFGGAAPALDALAAAGVRCRSLAANGTLGFDVAEPATAARVAAVFRPLELQALCPRGPASLFFGPCFISAPAEPGRCPPGAFAGVQLLVIVSCPLVAGSLRWLVATAAECAATLEAVHLGELCRLLCPVGNLLSALEALPQAVKVRLDFVPRMQPAAAVALLEGLAASPRLLRSVRASLEASRPPGPGQAPVGPPLPEGAPNSRGGAA
eukprot:tig00021017_g17188.t1